MENKTVIEKIWKKFFKIRGIKSVFWEINNNNRFCSINDIKHNSTIVFSTNCEATDDNGTFDRQGSYNSTSSIDGMCYWYTNYNGHVLANYEVDGIIYILIGLQNNDTNCEGDYKSNYIYIGIYRFIYGDANFVVDNLYGVV